MRIYLFIFAIVSVTGFTLPTGTEIIQGSAHCTPTSDTLQIQANGNAILHWSQFDISLHETVSFDQLQPQCAILGRVIQGPTSQILGKLTSNCPLYLINPQGIYIASTADIQTAGLIASTADLSNEAFLQGRELLFDRLGDGKITNLATVHAAQGDIYFIARSIDNQGTIQAPNGSVCMFTSEMLINPHTKQRTFIRFQEPLENERGIDNQGLIQALTIELKTQSPYEKAICHTGTLEALSAIEEHGQIYLMAHNGQALIDGAIHAEAGKISAVGKTIDVTQKAVIDASGNTGGVIDLGGGEGRNDPQFFQAERVSVEKGARLIADGLCEEGGKVVVWANRVVDFHGEISAQGNNKGGLVEIAALKEVTPDVVPNTRSLLGNNGEFIVGAAGPITITHSAALTPFTDSYIIAQLATGNFTINTATDAPSAGAQTITVNANVDVSWSTANSLTLIAGQNIRALSPTQFVCTGTGSISMTGGIVPAAATYPGIRLDGTTISCTEGSISLWGQGGTVASSSLYNGGVVIGVGGFPCSITTTSAINGNGAITVTGIAGTASSFEGPDGIDLQASSIIQTNAGDILLDGTITASTSFPVVEVIFHEGSTIQSTGTGKVTLNGHIPTGKSAIAGILLRGNATVGVKDGDLTLNLDADRVNNGVFVSNSVIHSTGAGNIVVNSSALAPATTSTTTAVLLQGTIQSTDTGTITINATAGASGRIGGIAASLSGPVSSAVGNIAITGTAQGTSSGNQGIVLNSGAQITQSGSGQISLTGTGSSIGAGTCRGILLNTNAKITSNTGPILLSGTGGAGASSNEGIFATGSGTQITTTNNSISLTGTGSGTGSSVHGIAITAAAQVTAAGMGNITLNGTASSTGTANNSGILVSGSSSAVSTSAGNINITAIGNGSGASNTGLSVISAGSIFANGGTITAINAEGGMGTTGGHGILIDGSSSKISAATGAIQLTGTGKGIGATNQGIRLSNAGSIPSTGTAPITLTGIGSFTGTTSNEGIFATGALTAISAVNGQIQLTATPGSGTINGITIDGGASVLTSTSGNILVNSTGGFLINNNSRLRTLGVSGPGLNDITVTTNGVSLLAGASGSALLTTIHGNIGITSTNLLILTASTSANSLAQMSVGNVANTLAIESLGASLTGGSGSGAFAEISTNGGLLTINGAGSIALTGGSNANTQAQILTKTNAIPTNAILIGQTTPPITLSLQGGSGASSRAIIASDFGGNILSTITGNTTITGGTGGTDSRAGIYTGLTSGTGDITLTGSGYTLTGGASGAGINSAEIATAASGGSINLTSTSGALLLQGGGGATANARIITLGTGNITLTATGNLSLFGAAGASSIADINSQGILTSNINTGNYILTGGSGASSQALCTAIGAVTLTGNNYTLTAGSSATANGSNALIQSTGANGTVAINSTATVMLNGGTAANQNSYIQTISLVGTNPISIDAAALQLSGSTTGGATNATAQIQTIRGNIDITTSGDITLLGGTDSVTNALISSTTQGNLTVQALNLTVQGAATTGICGIQTQSGDISVTCAQNCIYSMSTPAALSVMRTFGSDLTLLAGGSLVLNGIFTTPNPGNILLVAGVNIEIGSLSVVQAQGNSGSSLTLVVDNNFPTFPTIGLGQFILDAGAVISTGGTQAPLKMYTAKIEQNSINAPMNGLVFVPGTKFLNTSIQQWGIYAFGGTYEGSPFKFYYKNTGIAPPPAPISVIDLGIFFQFVEANLVELSGLLPVLKGPIRLHRFPTYHFQICQPDVQHCEPTFSPYDSFIFEDDVYWIKD